MFTFEAWGLIPDSWGIWIFSFCGCVLIEYAMLNSLSRRQGVGLDLVFSYLEFCSEISLSFLLSTILDFRLCREHLDSIEVVSENGQVLSRMIISFF